MYWGGYRSWFVSMEWEKALIVTELSGHGDEGMRNWIRMASRALARRGHIAEVLRLEGDPRWSSVLPRSLRCVRRATSNLFVYVPYSGLTSNALFRHLALRSAAASQVDVLVTLQSDRVVRRLPSVLSPALVAYASERLRDAHHEVARNSCVLPPMVDCERFRPSEKSRAAIREELGLPNDKPMALHIGHLRSSRGLEVLAELATHRTANVALVASTATEPESGVLGMLREAGVLVRREFLPGIEHWYQAADVYVFPVSDLQGSIEVPLTVLEAMACGIPVTATPFGGLPSLFRSSDSLRFAPPTQLPGVALDMIGVDGTPNRFAVEGMDEAAFVSEFEEAIERTAAHG